MARSPQTVNDSHIVREIPLDDLMVLYHLMEDCLGDRHWWPADSDEEIVIGAILVQNVSWSNVVVAVERLKQAGLLSFQALLEATPEQIESCIRTTLYYRMKAKKLKAFAVHLSEQHQGFLAHLFNQPMHDLREELLAIYGIGPETADDIVLYAARMPSFVVDTYTKRILHRLGWIAEDITYDELRNWLMRQLPLDERLYNQYHALLDGVGHLYCHRKKPDCQICPVASVCQTSSASTDTDTFERVDGRIDNTKTTAR